MDWVSNRLAAALAAVAALLAVGLGYTIVRSEQASHSDTIAQFHARAALAARLTGALLASDAAAAAGERRAFSGADSQLPRAMRAWAQANPAPLTALFAPDGRLLATSPRGAALEAAPLGHSAAARLALTRGAGLSNLIFLGRSRQPMIDVASSFQTPRGRRILLTFAPASALSVASGYLDVAAGMRGAAYMLDGSGRVLASTDHTRLGAFPAQRGLASAAASDPSGSVGGRIFVAAPVRATTDWRVVFSVRPAALYAPLASSARVDWLLFGALLAVLIAFVWLSRVTVRRSGQLVHERARVEAADRLAKERMHDALTGLPNRTLFLERAQEALDRRRLDKERVAVLFIDLDHFKRINDSLGHAVGDELLQLLAQRLQGALSARDTISRFGGDEFLVLCEQIPDAAAAVAIAERLRARLDQPFVLSSRRVHLTCSVGIALSAADGTPTAAATLVRDADAAMYDAKMQGYKGVRVFDDELHDSVLNRLDLELALGEAIRQGEIQSYYQPIVDLRTGELRGVEALARWERPGVGSISPRDFIPAAEDSGLIHELGYWILAAAMADVDRWFEERLVDAGFSLWVNVSPHQLVDTAFGGVLRGLLESWSLPPSSLCLEVTESAIAGDRTAVADRLAELSALGINIAIDDFGVGESSLAKLTQCKSVNALKLDQSFVASVSHPRSGAVVAAVAVVADALGIDAVAEGIETAEEALALTRLGYPLGQGYHFGEAAAFAPTRLRLQRRAHAQQNLSLAA